MKEIKNIKFKMPKRKPSPLELDKLRHYNVRTRNTLIQNTSFKLTASQQKIILHLIQKISADTTSLKFRFNVHDYEEFLGVKPDSRNTADIKRALKQLADKSFWLRTKDINSDHPNDEYDDLVRWFSMVRYNRTRGYFELQFDNRLKPFLLGIKNNFMSFDYHNIIGMRRSYSIRLYQIFVSHYNQQNKHYGYKYSINDLRFMVGLEPGKYRRFADLNRRVIRPSLQEMNAKTNFNFFYCPIKDGRKTIGIRILMKKKSKEQQRMVRDNTDRKLINGTRQKSLPSKSEEELSVKKSDQALERIFKRDVRKSHVEKLKKETLDQHREYLRKKAAKQRQKKYHETRKRKNYERYKKEYK